MKKLIDMTGETVGRLRVVRRVENRDGRAWWQCECECGAIKEISGKSLRNGKTQSCGCLQRETTSSRFIKHGYTDRPIYNVWLSMKQRCRNRNSKDFKHYGGRGIDYSDSWDSFENFLKDMGEMPKEGYSLERIDNNKGYNKENCIWADATTQARNRRRYKNNRTGVTGVFHNKQTDRYYANIRVGGDLLFLGSYGNIEDAIQKRKEAEKEYF